MNNLYLTGPAWLRHCLAGLLLLFLSGITSWAQITPDTTRLPPVGVDRRTDSLSSKHSRVIADSILKQRDSVFYSGLKRRMYKHRLTRQLYDAVFHDVYNSQQSTGEVSKIEVNPFKDFEGRVIGDIYIRRLGVFGQSVYDTLRQSDNWLERTANRLHVNTRERVIRRYLLFREGDALNSTTLRDNERLLRTTTIFHDARILVVPRTGSRQFVDVYVITQDVWSLEPNGGVGSLTQFSVGFDQRNVRGLGHQLFAQFAYTGTDPRQQAEYQTRYTVPYIGKTFLTAQAEFLYLRDLKQGAVRLYRPFITPDTKYAGSIELTHTQINSRVVMRDDSVEYIPLRYNYSDVWFGRSFRLFFKEGDTSVHGRARLILAVRNTNYQYIWRPPVSNDSNQLYQNSRTTLFSVGFSRRKYVRDVLIYGFGRTEDVPVGRTVSVIYGFDNAELGRRTYVGLNYSQGGYVKNLGYLYGLASIGGYVRSATIQQGVLSFESNYFSPLLPTGWGNMRQFINARYTTGINRFNNEYLSLSSSGSGINTDGIGINNDALRGTRRLVLNIENILFSKLNVVGFRIAFITFANLGMASFPDVPLLKSTLYQGYGIGFRLRNENLTFNSFQIRLSYYPNIPNNTIPFRQAFEGVPALRFRDFDQSAPQIIPYQ